MKWLESFILRGRVRKGEEEVEEEGGGGIEGESMLGVIYS